jgi:hypothetical protein
VDTDLASRLDRAIGPAPADDDSTAGELLRQGRRAVRRRRVAGALAAAAAVVVVGGGVALATSGGGPDRAAPPTAVDPSRSAVPETPDALVLVRFDAAGNLKIEPETEVLQFIDDPYQLSSYELSAAFRLAYRGREVWCVAYQDRAGNDSGASIDADQADGTFEQWVQDQRATLVEAP